MAGPTDLVSLFDIFLETVKDHKEGIAAKSGTNFSLLSALSHFTFLCKHILFLRPNNAF